MNYLSRYLETMASKFDKLNEVRLKGGNIDIIPTEELGSKYTGMCINKLDSFINSFSESLSEKKRNTLMEKYSRVSEKVKIYQGSLVLGIQAGYNLESETLERTLFTLKPSIINKLGYTSKISINVEKLVDGLLEGKMTVFKIVPESKYDVKVVKCNSKTVVIPNTYEEGSEGNYFMTDAGYVHSLMNYIMNQVNSQEMKLKVVYPDERVVAVRKVVSVNEIEGYFYAREYISPNLANAFDIKFVRVAPQFIADMCPYSSNKLEIDRTFYNKVKYSNQEFLTMGYFMRELELYLQDHEWTEDFSEKLIGIRVPKYSSGLVAAKVSDMEASEFMHAISVFSDSHSIFRNVTGFVNNYTIAKGYPLPTRLALREVEDKEGIIESKFYEDNVYLVTYIKSNGKMTKECVTNSSKILNAIYGDTRLYESKGVRLNNFLNGKDRSLEEFKSYFPNATLSEEDLKTLLESKEPKESIGKAIGLRTRNVSSTDNILVRKLFAYLKKDKNGELVAENYYASFDPLSIVSISVFTKSYF